MTQNRIFKSAGSIPSNEGFIDVSENARDWGCIWDFWVQRKLLTQFVGGPEDDDGDLLVGVLVLWMEGLIAGEIECLTSSHGQWLSFEFPYEATRRRKLLRHSIQLLVVFGPCLSQRPGVFVSWLW
ncbi:MAG: hypothetical protein U1G07_17795 [Verrucomicrobiota bacterium]